MMRLATLLATAACALATPAAAQTFAVTNATVATGDGSDPVENATVVVRGGRIAAVGAEQWEISSNLVWAHLCAQPVRKIVF